MLEHPPRHKAALHRARARRHRERVKQGRIVVRVELGPAELNWLASDRVRWITEAEANSSDAAAIGAGIARGLRVSARG
jgi:hypothetical protein